MPLTPTISVCMPMHNASRYLRECIGSVLAQTYADFEFLIADDGSTDNSVAIVESYSDPRIRLIKRPHDYIATLNCLLDEARGKYIARMDADDVMLPHRLQTQFDYMEAHPDVDVLGGAFIRFKVSGEEAQISPAADRDLNLDDFVHGCCICHPTAMLRTKTLSNIRYSKEYGFAEDYYLWTQLIISGKHLRNTSEVLIRYRECDSQVSTIHKEHQLSQTNIIQRLICKHILQKEYQCFIKLSCIAAKSDNKLTVIIPFLNEGEEVVNTVKSVRDTAGYKVDIIVINDHSSDTYPYKAKLSEFEVTYIYNDVRLGAALSKEKGIRNCRSKYFLLLDAHMRFFQNDWDTILTSLLDKKPNRVLCCQTIPMQLIDGKVERNEDYTKCYGAYISLNEKEYIPGIHWSATEKVVGKGLPDNGIPAILGAGYSSSCAYWQKLGGFVGLRHYGCEESYISIKAWMEGGGCHLVDKVSIGHLYRSTSPFEVRQAEFVYNYLFILASIFPKDIAEYGFKLALNANKQQYSVAQAFLLANEIILSKVQKRVRSFSGHDIDWIIALNRFYSQLNHEYTPTIIVANSIIDNMERQINNSTIDASLYNGATGYLILLAYYNSHHPSERIDHLIEKCVKIIVDTITTTDLSFSLRRGICGIGWGIIYLYSNRFIDATFLSLLTYIDEKLSLYSPARIADLSVEDGLAGIINYVSKRLSLCQNLGQLHHIDSTFLDELKCAIDSNISLHDNAICYTHCSNILNHSQKYARHLLRGTILELYTPPTIIPENINEKPTLQNSLAPLIKYYESIAYSIYEKE